MLNDFSKFVAFAKCTVITAEVVKLSGKTLRNDMRLHFNRILNSLQNFEKHLHRELGAAGAAEEDDINSSICHLVWSIFDMEADERERFLNYINDFNNDSSNTEKGS